MELTLPHLSQPLKLWEKLELVTGEGNEAGIYTARIEDFLGEGIVISSPEYIKGSTLLRENAEVRILFTKEDAAYQCYSRIKKHPVSGKNFYLLTPPRNVKRVQRRQFVRIDMHEQLRYARISPVMEWENYAERLEWTQTTTINMSGGGLLLKLNGELELLDRVFVQVSLFPGQGLPETVAGIVRRVLTIEKQMMAGIEFIVGEHLGEFFKSTDIKRMPASVTRFNYRAQNRLASYIFQQEIELRKKGLL